MSRDQLALLFFSAREHDEFDAVAPAQAFDQFVKQLIIETMVERIERGRSHDDQYLFALHAQCAQRVHEVWISLEVRQIDILFRSVIPPDLRLARAEPTQGCIW